MSYEKLLKRVEDLQNDLMLIDDYSEEVYQALQNTINELEEVIEND